MLTNEQILKKAIEKAVKNGFKTNWYRDGELTVGEEYGTILAHNNGLHALIFDHDFAKAFWGEEVMSNGVKKWKHGLQQMVLEKNPIKYLEKFL